MLQGVREFWLPRLLFYSTLSVATTLLVLVVAMPFLIEYVPASMPLAPLFAEDATVRRTSIAGAIGLIVTAFVFFRPSASFLSRKSSSKKPPPDTMAGA